MPAKLCYESSHDISFVDWEANTHPPCLPRFRVPLLQVQSYKRKIKQLEDDLLFRLSNSQGNLLDDTELIGILASTKQTAQVLRRCCSWRLWQGGGRGRGRQGKGCMRCTQH